VAGKPGVTVFGREICGLGQIFSKTHHISQNAESWLFKVILYSKSHFNTISNPKGWFGTGKISNFVP
jgi:hypothetical protein